MSVVRSLRRVCAFRLVERNFMSQSIAPDRFIESLTEDGRYRLLVEAVTDYAIYMLDKNGIVTSWNPGARRFKGYEQAEIIGEHFSRFYTEEDRARGLPARALATAAAEGKFEGEGWRVRKDGKRFWANVVIDPIRDPTGELIGYAKITRDLTEQKAAEATLRSSEEQFRRLVQGVTDYSIYMLDPNGRVASWNTGAQRIKGYTPEEIIGEHFSRFYTEEDRQNGAPARALATARREGRFEKEGWRVRKNGERFWANVIIDAIREGEGEIIGFAKITRDITEQQNARLALDRTREALFQSQKMEAVGQLTGGIAHDFNNLLTAIIGSLEIAERRVSDASVKRLINNAMRGAQRGASLTQRMLVFARRQELDVQPVDIPTLVRGMGEMLERSLGPSVLIETRFPINLQWVKTDSNQLEMALLNLMVNARDAMPQGGSIIVAARPQTLANSDGQLQPGSYVCLSVTDTGEGMDEDTLSKAADPFFTTKEIGKGTGLGLPMVHGLAKESGGKLVLKSQKGKGTTVELWLPVAEKSPVAAAETAASAPAETVSALTILVVDDDPIVLTNMAAMLEDLGHIVFEATSALEALAILRRESAIQLVLTDQAMPQMTGAQLIEEIKTGWPKLAVILASGYAELPSGIDPLQITLAKPFLQYDLAQAVKAALQDPKRRRVVRFRPS
jgi:PAS domain S-box-containing protein